MIQGVDSASALAIEKWGWKYHHTGTPTTAIKDGKKYIPHRGFYASGFSESPFGIEWMRLEANSPIHPLAQKIPHIAFEADDLDYELAHHIFKVITAPGSPSAKIQVAMLKHNGAPVELIEFKK